jgi:hypothetical protein
MIRPFHRGVFCAALMILLPARSATADGPTGAAAPAPVGAAPGAPPLISASGACPGLDLVSGAVTALIPHGGLDALPRLAAVEVEDLGQSYRVKAVAEGVDRVRVFRDVGRDCEQRARFAAVFIVLTLLPPELVIDVQPPPPPPPPPRAPEEPPRRTRLDVAAVFELAPPVFDAPQIVAPGGELRIARRFGWLAGVVGAGVEPRSSFTKDGLQGREMRFPFDLGLRAARPFAAWELDGEAAIAAAIFRAQGLNTLMPQQGTRLDLGGRVGIAVRLGRPSARAVPFLGLHALVFPRPYEIATTPQGSLGSTPAIWLGATLGLSASL